jgi:cytochrome c
MRTALWLAAAAALAACAMGGCFKKTTLELDKGTRDDQWARGVWLYSQSCANCHGENGEGDEDVPPLAGEGALPASPREGSERNGSFDTAADVFDYVKKAMPPLDPGSLSDEQYYAIVLYVMKQAGIEVPKGTLGRENAADVKLR